MAKNIVIAGYGPGISTAVAEKFGAQGFHVAIVGRNPDKLGAGVKALEAKGVKASSFVADLGDPDAVRGVIAAVRASLGPISVIEWTAYSPGSVAGDLMIASDADIRALFGPGISGLLAAVQAAHADLKSERGAVLVTNGAAGFIDPKMDEMCVQWGMMGLGVANAAKQKLVGMLAKKLAPDGIYVGEIMIAGTIKGTSFDQNNAMTIDSKDVADKYWELYTQRTDTRFTFSRM